ncbi:MAG: ribbon-helix-helix protein, CopG family [Campylobacterales bacterium]|nr:ribbon-helix-helix protein, CopG family [Campylobacterales bacterium]
MTIRKNFLLDEEIAEHLEKMAKQRGITQTEVVKNLIEQEYEEYSKEEKLEAIYQFAGSGSGLWGDLTIQEVKANWDV